MAGLETLVAAPMGTRVRKVFEIGPNELENGEIIDIFVVDDDGTVHEFTPGIVGKILMFFLRRTLNVHTIQIEVETIE